MLYLRLNEGEDGAKVMILNDIAPAIKYLLLIFSINLIAFLGELLCAVPMLPLTIEFPRVNRCSLFTAFGSSFLLTIILVTTLHLESRSKTQDIIFCKNYVIYYF